MQLRAKHISPKQSRGNFHTAESTMDIEMTAPPIPSITPEDRIALSFLLMDIYMFLDHPSITDAIQVDGDTLMSNSDLVLVHGEHQYPSILTTQIILDAALKQLQLSLHGEIKIPFAASSSLSELIDELKAVLPPNAKKGWDDLGKLQVCVKMVIEQLARGNTAVEPVATYVLFPFST
jgi:hypothetical protein